MRGIRGSPFERMPKTVTFSGISFLGVFCEIVTAGGKRHEAVLEIC